MRVVFLALGATRRLAVTEESRLVAAAGGRPVVVVQDRKPWTDETFAPGVEVVPLAGLGDGHWPMTAEQFLLYRAPRFLLRRAGGRHSGRLVSAYERRIAHRLHRRAFLPLYRRIWCDGADRPFEVLRRRYGPFHAIVVTDAQSFPAAQRLAADGRIQVAFRVDQLLTPADRRTATPEDNA